jgi:2-dehydro-3-deoxygalactonokinase
MQPLIREARTVLCDWGTSRLRAYLQVGDQVVARCEGPGIGALISPAIAALQQTLRLWRNAAEFDQIVACGMIGSRNGIVEVPYVQAPAGLSEWAARALTHQAEDAPLLIAAGICGPNFAGIMDVMRGEETQIFGAIACNDTLTRGRHTLLLPGTHSKWVQVIEGRIETVQTYVTGELFALLKDHSSLFRAGDSGEPPGDGFAAGLARSRQSGLAASLFETRAAQLTQARPRAWASEFLSGVLIGDEITAALRTCEPSSVVLVGENTLTMRYREALSRHGIAATCLDGDQCVVAGLRLLASHRHAH